MADYKHSVSLDIEKCKGCTNCLKRCPTEAIRIRVGHAVINSARCIDCGECIRVCPYKAKKAISDKLDSIKDFKWKIALPAPSLYGQFDGLDDIDYVLQGLYDLGFDDVYEVAKAAELVSGYTRRYLKKPDTIKPVISSACPVIIRLISLRFPYLCKNVMPLLSPMEIAGMLAKQQAMERDPSLKESDIATCFISPCPAKVSYVKNEFSGKNSYVDCVVSMSDIYFALLGVMKKEKPPQPLSRSGLVGIGWASTGGESSAIFNDKYLAADGIENVMRVLDEIDNGTFPELEFIELNACNGGCVGGTMAVENPYIAKARLQTLKRYLPVSQNWNPSVAGKDDKYIPEDFLMSGELEYKPVSQLAKDTNEAIKKMADIQKVRERLPDLDCGSCGSPTCQAFAYDVVKGETNENECVVKMRERMNELLRVETEREREQ
ncbi:MAG: ferredoxin [Firmicutes bacterium HGW-Firmicutes-21]|nr:MAG: ferredoxin [Firmicutes bacterium HGW-Firmicutes-21]